jgi:Na+-translocating ferredoxin:NAD+ oxidoreductase RnfC subunit
MIVIEWSNKMDLKQLKKIMQENGIVGAGGAGFPTYAKFEAGLETIILNCSECEPLLKLHRQLLKKYAYEIVKTFSLLADVVEAKEAVIGIKEEYKDTNTVLKEVVVLFPKVRLQLLESSYPMGDEVVLIYETTGKVVKPGKLPLELRVAVFNVETIYNVYCALEHNKPVTEKIVSVVGEVTKPVTVRVPLGCTLEQVVALAGEITTTNPIYFLGGPMMGSIGIGSQRITKTTNAILVLPKDHIIIRKKLSKASIELNRAASTCCQCQACTDLCPRNMLGQLVEPHKFMRAAAGRDFQNADIFVNTLFCCACGLCEMYSCPQGLSPRSLMADCKAGLKKAGVKIPQDIVLKPVNKQREYRKIPEKRLTSRLDLAKYDVDALLEDELVPMNRVKLLMNQHIGVPAQVIVSEGDCVLIGQMIAKPAEALSVAIHASISGKVVEACKEFVVIQKID